MGFGCGGDDSPLPFLGEHDAGAFDATSPALDASTDHASPDSQSAETSADAPNDASDATDASFDVGPMPTCDAGSYADAGGCSPSYTMNVTGTMLGYGIDAAGGMTMVTVKYAPTTGEFRHQCFDSNGAPTGPDALLATYDYATFSVGVSARVARARATKQTIVAYTLESGSDQRIYYAYLGANCVIKTSGRLDPATPGTMELRDVAISDNGGAALMFSNDVASKNVLYFFDNAGSVSAPIELTEHYSRAAHVAMRRTNGDTIVVATDESSSTRKRYFKRFTGAGAAIDATFIGTPATLDTTGSKSVMVGMRDDGAFAILARGMTTKVHAAFYDASAAHQTTVTYDIGAGVYDFHVPITSAGNFVFLIPASGDVRNVYSLAGTLISNSSTPVYGSPPLKFRLDSSDNTYYGLNEPQVFKNALPL